MIKQWLIDNSAPIFGAVLGGLIMKGNLWNRIGAIFAGATIAVLATPFIAERLSVTPMDASYSGVSFLVGMFGLNLSKKIFDADFTSIIRTLINR